MRVQSTLGTWIPCRELGQNHSQVSSSADSQMGGAVLPLRLWGRSPCLLQLLGAPGDPSWWLSGSRRCSNSLSVPSSVSHKDTSHSIGADTLIQGNLLSISLIPPARTLCLNEGHRGSALEAGCWFGSTGYSEHFPVSRMK